jgi:type II secretory pathway component PulF
MLEAGMPLLGALEGVGSAAGNSEIEARILLARARVARGEPLADALEREHVLSPSVLPLITLGEQTGQLGGMTLKAADLAARESERTIGTLVSVIEPGLIVTFGGVVAFVAAALLQAVYALRPS